MQFQNNTLDLSTHSFLDFDTDAGKLSVNVGRQQIQFAHSDLSFGKGTFEMNVSHIYSSIAHISGSFYGKNWKLNLEQYVLPYSTSMNIKDFNAGDYVYIDGKGLIHRFVKYDTTRYLDASGNNVILIVSYGTAQMQFPDGSFLNFDSNGRLTNFVTLGKTYSIIKEITYDSSGRITKYCDTRRKSKKERYVGFEYTNTLLKKMFLMDKGVEQEAVYYIYDNYSNLKGIFHFIKGILASVSFFKYDSNNHLILATGTSQGSATVIEYNATNLKIKNGTSKILLGSSAPVIGNDSREYVLLDNEIYLGDNLQLFTASNNLDLLYQSLSCEDFVELNSTSFTYYSSYVDILNTRNITYRYYFNTKGEVTSQFEVDGNTLRTLHIETGYSAMYRKPNGYTGDNINQRGIVSREIGKGMNVIAEDKFLDEALKTRNYETKYRKDNCYDYIHFKVGFFVRHNCTNASYMTATFSFTNYMDNVKDTVQIDCKATNAWQYVEIPFSQANDSQKKSYGISSGSIKIESDGTGTYEVCDIHFDGASRSFLYLGSYGNYKDIKKFYSFTIEQNSGSKKTILLNGANYVTDSDMILNWILMERKVNTFDFVYCNGTKRIPNVKNVSFRPTEYSDSSRIDYIFNYLNQVTKDVLDRQTTSAYSSYSNGLIKTTTETSGDFFARTEDQRDLQGRVIYSIDSYGKKTVNEYDGYGNLLSTIVAKKEDFDSNNKVIKDKKRLYLLYGYVEELEEYRENISSIKNEESSIEFSYDDTVINQCNAVQTNDNMKTNYIYDCINRFSEIHQEETKNHVSYDSLGNIKSYSDNDSYEYEISGDAKKSSVAIKRMNSSSKQTLGEASVDYKNNSTKITDSMLDTFVLIENNKYNQPTRHSFVGDSGERVNITYQNIGDETTSDGLTNSFDESLSIAAIKKITCPFTDNSYDFIYDNTNHIKEYTMRNGSNTLLSIKKENTLSTKFDIGEKGYVTTKEYNKNPLQNRIIKTRIGDSTDSDYSKFTYSYEYHPVLGTITKKIGGNSTREIFYENQDNANYYSSLPQRITQKYGNNSFDIVYGYNQSNDIIKTTGYSSLAVLTTSYSYDENHRISKEGNINLDIDYSYQYNKFNRLSKVYKNGSLYKEFTYDSLGRLLSVQKDRVSFKTFEYKGDNLYPNKMNNLTCKFSRNGLLYSYGNNSYEYDYNGLRYSKKTFDNKITKYYYVGDKLLGEDYSNGVKIRYMYDQEGIIGARYHCGNLVTEYEYAKDGFNNVVAIVKDNTIVVRYVYDSWGNIIRTIPENVTDSFARINPIRYRSYYYDIETELYYLQTRYYDPAIGAFISPDSVDYLEEENIGGLNLYTYCYNNPVMYCDPSGHSAIIVGLIIGAIVGAAVGGALAYSLASQNGKEGWELAGFTILGIFGGALLGATIGAGLGYIWGATLSFTIPTLGFVNSGGILGIGVTGSMSLAIPLGKIIVVGGVYELAKGLTIMAASNERPRNNKKQNEQVRSALRELGYDPKSSEGKEMADEIEREIRKNKLSLGYRALVEFIKDLFGLL